MRGEAARGPYELAALLLCFNGKHAAAKARRSLERRLRSGGMHVYDVTVLQVNEKHGAAVHNPRRVVAGALTATLTWGIFGLVTGGLASLITSAALGAIWGGTIAYLAVHHPSKAQLARLGGQLPAPSSALLAFVRAHDPAKPLAAAAAEAPSTTSVALIAEDLVTRVFTGDAAEPVELPPASPSTHARLSMILTRYPDTATAGRIASQIASTPETPLDVELITQTDRSGRRHVVDPKLGSGAIARANLPGWAGLGLVCGVIAGITGGSGPLGILESGLVTGVVWGLFGLGAGALYGLWAGRAISARRLKGIGPILAPGTSTLLAWTDTPLADVPTQSLTPTPTTQQLILSFKPGDRGAILETTQ